VKGFKSEGDRIADAEKNNQALGGGGINIQNYDYRTPLRYKKFVYPKVKFKDQSTLEKILTETENNKYIVKKWEKDSRLRYIEQRNIRSLLK
jgi:hypothetical protein